jgi:hypothetical protein
MAGVFCKLYLDPVFKLVFTNVLTAAAFIRDVLRLSGLSVQRVQPREVEEGVEEPARPEVVGMAIEHVGDRSLSLGREVRRVVYDAYCVVHTAAGDVETIIEMQNAPHTHFVKRMWGYMAFSVASQWRSTWGQHIADHGESLGGPDAALDTSGGSGGSSDAGAGAGAGAANGQQGSTKRARGSSSGSSSSSSSSGGGGGGGGGGDGGRGHSGSRGGSSVGRSTGRSSGRGPAYDFRPAYVIGITNFEIPEAAGPRRASARDAHGAGAATAAAMAAAAAASSSSSCSTSHVPPAAAAAGPVLQMEEPGGAAAASPISSPQPPPQCSCTQWFRMDFDQARYTPGELPDEALRAQFAALTTHAVMQLPHAPSDALLRPLTAQQARARFPRSDLWASLLRHAHLWTDASTPPVFAEPPFAAVLEAARCSAFDSNATFMQAYRQAESLELALHDSELAHGTRLALERDARLAAEEGQRRSDAARLAAEEGLRLSDAMIASLQQQLARAHKSTT